MPDNPLRITGIDVIFARMHRELTKEPYQVFPATDLTLDPSSARLPDYDNRRA